MSSIGDLGEPHRSQQRLARRRGPAARRRRIDVAIRQTSDAGPCETMRRQTVSLSRVSGRRPHGRSVRDHATPGHCRSRAASIAAASVAAGAGVASAARAEPPPADQRVRRQRPAGTASTARPPAPCPIRPRAPRGSPSTTACSPWPPATRRSRPTSSTTTRPAARASSRPSPTPSPTQLGFDHDHVDVGAHDVRRRHPARARRTSTSTSSSTRSRPSASEVGQLQPAVLHRPTRRSSATPTRRPPRPTTLSRPAGAAHRRRRRHDEPDVRHRRHPARRRPVQIFNDNADRQAGPRHPADRRHRRRPADGAVHRRRRDGGRRPCSASSRPPTRPGEPWGMLFEKDNPLVECVELALAEPAGVGRARRDHDRVDGHGRRRADHRTRRVTLPADAAVAWPAPARRRRDAVAPPGVRAPPAAARIARRHRAARSSSSASLVWLVPKTSGWQSVQQSFFSWPDFTRRLPQAAAAVLVRRADLPVCAPCIIVLGLLDRHRPATCGRRRCTRCGCAPRCTPTSSAASR